MGRSARAPFDQVMARAVVIYLSVRSTMAVSALVREPCWCKPAGACRACLLVFPQHTSPVPRRKVRYFKVSG
ncbi:hypothetical protein BDZ94DRAFT_1249548 [Collybia nuda]|uniref:Uncharacterized protein n=1 Tax=Collybia nuda TaxID=64659 RepID=A0A9P6CI14_9AGAR|nr:hypothetical protein BDZ94DRAFT_1249548 [Collybia nuda]